MLSNLTDTAHSLSRAVLEIIYPLSCGGCGKAGHVLCNQCIDALRPLEEESTCPVCGRWLGKKTVCGECIEQGRGFQEGHYGFYYENSLRDAVHAFKFQGRKDVCRRLVRMMRERILSFSACYDCIIPVPVTQRRLKERGFNQSYIIGEEISKITDRPIYHSTLCKVKETKDQFSLNRDERKRNIKGAFSVKNRDHIKTRRVLLVDDLFTTGYTAREASKVLLKSGAASVIFFALARTP